MSIILIIIMAITFFLIFFLFSKLFETLLIREKVYSFEISASHIEDMVKFYSVEDILRKFFVNKTSPFQRTIILKKTPGENGFFDECKKNGLDPQTIVQLLSQKDKKISFENENSSIISAFPMRNVQEGILVIKGSLSDLRQQFSSAKKMMFLSFFLVLIIVIFTGYSLLTFFVIRPVKRVINAIEEFSESSGEVKKEKRIGNELKILENSFKRMKTTLKERQVQIERQIREIKKSHDELKKTQDSLIRSEKLASVGVLASGIAHEIGNPVGILLGFIEILKREKDNKRAEEYLQAMEEATYKIHRIIKDLLAFARPQKEEGIGESNIPLVIERTLQLLSPQKKFKSIEIKSEWTGEKLFAEIHQSKLEQVLINILLNAADSMDEKGKIEIKAWEKEDYVFISIKDSGKGIEEDNINKIWDPFWTTKKVGEGTGLGLCLCYQIISTYGGDISVKSKVSEGSTFTIKLKKGGLM